MEYRTAIVDECGCVMWWCDELQRNDQIECILVSHPEWSMKAIEVENGGKQYESNNY